MLIEVASVHQPLRLRCNRLRDRRVRMAQRADGDAADAIEVAASAVIDQLTAFARDDRYRGAFVRVEQHHVR